MSAQNLLVTTSAAEFFHDHVAQAQERQKIQLGEEVEFYVVQLLIDFVRTDASAQDECLALVLAKAQESSYGEQIHLYKRLGDTSLYFAGMFQEFFARRSFDVGYYVSMGENAYTLLSGIMRHRSNNEQRMSNLYAALAGSFRQSVDVLLDVSEHTGLTKEPTRTVLSLYESWLATASEKLEGELLDRGIIPIPQRKKIVQ